MLSALAATALATACGGAGPATPATLSPMAEVGRQIFADTALSASGVQSCATCHVASAAFAGADGLPVPMGGPAMNLPGLRATPSLAYASYTPAFHFATDGTPVGGFFRDGRAASLAAQAQGPFVNGFEMANASADEVRRRLLARPCLTQFQAVFGAAVLQDPAQTLASIGAALAAFETEDGTFHAFSSKFDAVQSGQATFTPAELAGQQAFNDPTRGNCTACHPSTPAAGVAALFTDFTYDSVGIPRNWAIPANQAGNALPYVPQNGAGAPDAYYDMGLCGPLRTDLSTRRLLCGAFKVPTLRNAAVKQNYFHNGVFTRLSDVVTWYATRDSDPARWYLTEQGLPDTPYNDLPPALHASINQLERPYNPMLAPTLTSVEIAQIVSFLCTLTDGWDGANPAAYGQQPQCLSAVAAAR